MNQRNVLSGRQPTGPRNVLGSVVETASNVLSELFGAKSAEARMIGPKAKTYDHEAAKRAQEMASSGAAREDVWRDTGTWQDRGGMWWQERDPVEFRNWIWTPGTVQASEALGPDAGIFKDYPELADYLVSVERMDPTTAGSHRRPSAGKPGVVSVADDMSVPDQRRTLLHELAGHAAQGIERTSRGANPVKFMFDYVNKQLQPLRDQYDHAFERRRQLEREYSRDVRNVLDHMHGYDLDGNTVAEMPLEDVDREIALSKQHFNPLIEQAEAERNRLLEEIRAFKPKRMSLVDATKLYERNLGEANARLVERRLGLMPGERAARAPWLDYDVPEEELRP